jgi:GT2 family glycosyltransferase
MLADATKRRIGDSTPLSIIIVNWNTRELLRDCLGSVFASPEALHYEVLVVDNASTDGSHEMVENKFPNVKLIKNQKNRGFAAANNQALEIASGEYLLLLNSDTIIHGDVLERSLDYMIARGDVGAMGCRVLNMDGSLQPTCSRFPTLMNLLLLTSGLARLPWPRSLDRYQMRRWDRHDERAVDVISGCYMLVRRVAVNEVGLLDDSFFFFGEETDWCRRFQEAGWKLYFAPVGEITHHGGGSAKRLNYRRDLLLSSSLVRLHRKHGGFWSALAAWQILFVFNIVRASYWTIRSVVTSGGAARARRDHFLGVVRNFRQAWVSRDA